MMETRQMKKLGIDMPLLGMGLMRLPMKGDVVDDEIAIEMVDRMYKAGVRYFDTAYVYMNGESERFAKRALTDRYPRDSFFITSKLPVEKATDAAAGEAVFNESCRRLGVDYIDFYLLHGINLGGWHKFKENGCAELQRRLKAEGRIRYAGFSFHGSPDDLRGILAEQPDWDFIQLQVNYYDWYTDTAKELYEIVTSRGIPLIIMEPVRGGGLVNLGDDVSEMFRNARPGSTNAGWAMRWIGSQPGVNVVLSGVSTLEQVDENVKVYAPLEKISDEEETVIKKVVETLTARPYIPCTGCRYCGGCPQEVSIPSIFSAANELTRLNDAGKAMWQYFQATGEEHRATACVGCGYCVTQCPQGIDIPSELQRVHKMLTALKGE